MKEIKGFITPFSFARVREPKSSKNSISSLCAIILVCKKNSRVTKYSFFPNYQKKLPFTDSNGNPIHISGLKELINSTLVR